VQVLFSGATGVMPHAKSGKLKTLAVSSLKRSRLLPELPTVAESGLPGFESIGWYGLLAPVRTPPPIVLALNRELIQILNLPNIQESFAADGAEAAPESPAEFKSVINRDLGELAKLIKNLNLKL
jgi:tripartite-type tricarboxylate transporter receptor subunit TctC